MKIEKHELKSIGIGTALVIVNIALMAAFSEVSVLVDLFDYLWQWPIVGVIAFGILLTGGNWLGRSGIENGDTGLATIGTAMLMAGYGIFGAGIISMLDFYTKLTVLAITAVITTIIAVVAGIYVYWTDRDLRKTGRYANYSFIGVLGTAFIGTLWPPLTLLAFILALTGFLLYLVYEIWRMKTERVDPVLSGFGLYIAYAGVFVQILQLVVRSYLEE